MDEIDTRKFELSNFVTFKEIIILSIKYPDTEKLPECLELDILFCSNPFNLSVKK